MQPELAVAASIVSLTPSPSVSEVHDVLRHAADVLGGRPMSVRGPGPTFCWRLGERGVTIDVSTFVRRRVRFASFPWSRWDDEIYRRFKWTDSSADLPYLWSLPIAGGQEWYPGNAIASGWAEFFNVFGSCFDSLPKDLQAIPPEWRPSGPVVTSMWNVDGDVAGGVTVEVSADGVLVSGEGPQAFQLDIPADRLGHKQVKVPALLAGLTRTGAFGELQFWENETPMDVFPTGRRAEDDEPDDLADSRGPRATQSVQEARELIAAEPPAPAQRPGRPAPPTRPFVPTIPVDHALELATQLAQYNHDAPNVLRAWGVELDGAGKGSLQGGLARCRSTSGGTQHLIQVALAPANDERAHLEGVWAYADQVTTALIGRFGPPLGTGAASDGSGSRLWNVGSVGLVLEITRDGIGLDIGDSDEHWRKLVSLD